LDDATAADQAHTLGLGTGDSPKFAGLTLDLADRFGAALYYASNDNSGPGVASYKRGSPAGATAAVANTGQLAFSPANGWNGSAYYMGGYCMFRAAEDWSTTACGTDIIFVVTKSRTATRNIAMTVLNSNNVLIGTTTDSASAILNVASTTKGALLPRMTTTQRDAISAPTEGMLIYNTTTHCLDHYNGSAWAAV
jgi:hypothetical protein